MFGIFVALVIALISVGAHAQSPQDLTDPTPPPTPDATAEVADPSVTSGPTIYVTDKAGRLATITLGTYAVHIIGSEGVVLTDIGFNPKDGQLYGITKSVPFLNSAGLGRRGSPRASATCSLKLPRNSHH